MTFRSNLEDAMERFESRSLSMRIDSIGDKLDDIKKRKEFGVFLTERNLSAYLAKKIGAFKTIIDPACGSGDLLISCVEQAIRKNRHIEKISGIDVHKEFSGISKKRIISEFEIPKKSQSILNFKTADAMDHLHEIGKHDCVVMNPPYVNVKIKEKISWGKGKTQYAGYFLYKILKSAKKGQRILAILPDVLRSGSRYEKWRKEIEALAKVNSIDVVGRFSKLADVDVFVLDLKAKGKNIKSVKWTTSSYKKKIEDYFEVKVGNVVDYRDPILGKYYSFLDTSNAKPMMEVNSLDTGKKRRFQGSVISPPFVVVRRTSSPSDKNRIMPTLVRGRKPVAVENHLIVLKPKDRKVSTCLNFISATQTRKVNNWVNKRIRCRHLTVGVVKEIPI